VRRLVSLGSKTSAPACFLTAALTLSMGFLITSAPMAHAQADAARCFSAEGAFASDTPSDGQNLIEGTVTNRCTDPVAGTIRLTALNRTESSDASVEGFSKFEIRLGTIAPGGSQGFQIPVGRDLEQASYTWRYGFRSMPAGSQGYGLPGWRVTHSDVGLYADARLEGDLFQLNKVELGQQLLWAAANNGVVLRTERLAPGIYGAYRMSARTVLIDRRLMAYGCRRRAAILAHELQHALDHAEGKLRPSGSKCFANEEDAFMAQARVWAALWDYRLPSSSNSVRTELNDITRLAVSDPYQLLGDYVAAYDHECS